MADSAQNTVHNTNRFCEIFQCYIGSHVETTVNVINSMRSLQQIIPKQVLDFRRMHCRDDMVAINTHLCEELILEFQAKHQVFDPDDESLKVKPQT